MEDTISPEEKIELPQVGMVFESFEGVFDFHKQYGKGIGFEGFIRSSRKGDDGQLKFVTMLFALWQTKDQSLQMPSRCVQ